VGKSLESRFEEYGEVIGAALAHADRRTQEHRPLRSKVSTPAPPFFRR
jgi:hypothetical protein